MIDVDFHSHILPYIDDGAKDTDVSQKMLLMLKEQGIKTVAATSHFDASSISTEDFLAKRSASYEALSKSCDLSEMPRIVLGAEVYCTEKISKIDLAPLCYDGTNYLLLELPRLPYGDWIIEELEIITYKQKLVPIIAHIDRYMEWYSDRDIDSLLSFDDAVFQINNRAFTKKKTSRVVTDIIKAGYPVVLGSDAHDTEHRKPNFDVLNKTLGSFMNKRSLLPKLKSTYKKIKI